MHNELFSIGPVTIYGYGLMIAIGILLAYFFAVYRAKKRNLSDDPIFSILICAVFFGFLGAKLLYIITVLDEIIKDPKLLWDVADGFVVYGGIISGFSLWVRFPCVLSCHSYLLPHQKNRFFHLSRPDSSFGRTGSGIWSDWLFFGGLLLRC